jgi:putative methanogenesis marker protein 17
MEIDVVGVDSFGAEAYRNLFGEIMADIGKAFHIEKALLVLKPDVPLFIFSVVLKTEPGNITITDIANIREEGEMVHLAITDERYAPDLIKGLWARYGKGAVNQQTRFDIVITNASKDDVGSIVVASGEEYMKEIIGAIWRSMPEGIKNRHTFIDGQTVTVVATEERFQPSMLKDGLDHHKKMVKEAGKDV